VSVLNGSPRSSNAKKQDQEEHWTIIHVFVSLASAHDCFDVCLSIKFFHTLRIYDHRIMQLWGGDLMSCCIYINPPSHLHDTMTISAQFKKETQNCVFMVTVSRNCVGGDLMGSDIYTNPPLTLT
jgi:hypothetical protein